MNILGVQLKRPSCLNVLNSRKFSRGYTAKSSDVRFVHFVRKRAVMEKVNINTIEPCQANIRALDAGILVVRAETGESFTCVNGAARLQVVLSEFGQAAVRLMTTNEIVQVRLVDGKLVAI